MSFSLLRWLVAKLSAETSKAHKWPHFVKVLIFQDNYNSEIRDIFTSTNLATHLLLTKDEDNCNTCFKCRFNSSSLNTTSLEMFCLCKGVNHLHPLLLNGDGLECWSIKFLPFMFRSHPVFMVKCSTSTVWLIKQRPMSLILRLSNSLEPIKLLLMLPLSLNPNQVLFVIPKDIFLGHFVFHEVVPKSFRFLCRHSYFFLPKILTNCQAYKEKYKM